MILAGPAGAAITSGPVRLFDDNVPPQHLKLLSATPFKTGVLHLVYGPDPNPPTNTYDDAVKTWLQE
jgi:hypothetical protein